MTADTPPLEADANGFFVSDDGSLVMRSGDVSIRCTMTPSAMMRVSNALRSQASRMRLSVPPKGFVRSILVDARVEGVP